MADQLKPICLVAGKSGGHIIPCLTIAQQQFLHHPIFFFSTNAALDAQLLGAQPLKRWVRLPVGGPTVTWHAKLLLLPRLFIAFILSFYQLLRFRPAQLISTGGLVAIPVCVAAWLLRIPINLYELNAVPGKAIKLLAPCATQVNTCFVSAQRFFKGGALTDYPIRFGSSLTDDRAEKNNKDFTILIIGGSQGSIALNKLAADAIAFCAEQFPQVPLRVLHQTGGADQRDWPLFYRERTINADLFTYSENLADYYAQADLIICRAGAGTLFEVHYFAKPCIMIPLEGLGGDHQLENARAMAREYGEHFRLVRQQDASTCAHAIMEYLDGYVLRR